MVPKPTAIPPYWTRFASFFLYPLSLEPLLACIAIGLLSGLSSLLFTLAGVVVQLLLLVATLRYGYKVLERTARGNLDDGLANIDRSSGGKYRPYKQFVVIAIGMTLVGYAAGFGSHHLAMILLVLFAMLLPANTMVLALTDDLGESLSPPRLWEVMHGIGVPYLGLCACLLLLSSSSGALLGLLLPVVPMSLLNVLGGFIGAYFIIVMFRLMGYTLYQYHAELGFAVDVGFESQVDAVGGDPVKQRLAESTALLKAGQYAEAIALDRAEVTARPDDFAANLRLHRLLLAVPGQASAMLAQASEWLPSLLRSARSRQAAEVIEAIWREQPDYRPALGAWYLPLAEALFAVRRYDSAAHLIKGFDRRFPGHADIAAIYLLGARLLIEHRRDEAQARRVLDALRRHFPASPAAAEADQLLALLDRLAGVAEA
ncbi:MAG: hypothetical protein CVU34_03635 [Betaproteobacteria bacterium HGW-Betaproteobacteria-7]|jgi:tetratricopeptide (TPR) repeat protein|nr:MAG: hypothetical protein CVU34_03635 [Betaproteobacteria bacterium HGW-Betaproteobacteria-7]